MKQRSADRGRIAGEEAPISQAPTVGALGRKAGGATHEGLAACESYEGRPAAVMHRKRGGGVAYAEGGSTAKRHDRPGRKSGGWIAGAVKKPGSFTKSADKAGASVQGYAEEHKNDSGTLGKRARLALTFQKMAHKPG